MYVFIDAMLRIYPWFSWMIYRREFFYQEESAESVVQKDFSGLDLNQSCPKSNLAVNCCRRYPESVHLVRDGKRFVVRQFPVQEITSMSFSVGWYSAFVCLLTIKASIERLFQAAYHILGCSSLIFFNSSLWREIKHAYNDHYMIPKTLKIDTSFDKESLACLIQGNSVDNAVVFFHCKLTRGMYGACKESRHVQ